MNENKYLIDIDCLKEWFKCYMLDKVDTQEKYNLLTNYINFFSYDELVLFKCLTENLSWEYAQKLMDGNYIMNTINGLEYNL